MELTEIRNKIDALDEEIKALLLQRLACSKEVAEAKAEKGEDGKKVGRNDPCPCGSGKKYKNCHGKDK